MQNKVLACSRWFQMLLRFLSAHLILGRADGIVMTELVAALMTDVPSCSSDASSCYFVSRSNGKEHLLSDGGAPGQQSWPGPHIIAPITPPPPMLRCWVTWDHWLYFISLLIVICPPDVWPNTSRAWHPWAHFLPDTNRIWNNDCIRMGGQLNTQQFLSK